MISPRAEIRTLAYDMPIRFSLFPTLRFIVPPSCRDSISAQERNGGGGERGRKNTSRLEYTYIACTENQFSRASIALLYSFTKGIKLSVARRDGVQRPVRR